MEHTVKPDGVWVRVKLDQASQYARRVWEAAKEGLAATSSGSIAHLVRKAADGFIAAWPFVELSLFNITESQVPANRRAMALPVAKALYQAAGREFPAEIDADLDLLLLRARAILAIQDLDTGMTDEEKKALQEEALQVI